MVSVFRSAGDTDTPHNLVDGLSRAATLGGMRLREWLLTQDGQYVIEIVAIDRRKRTISSRRPKFRLKPIFAWYDFWVGAFFDRKHKQLYIFPVPMLGFKIGFQ